METLERIISLIAHWVVIPCILVSIFVFAIAIVGRSPRGLLRTSANAGFWAGLVVFVIYVVSQLDRLNQPSFDINYSTGIKLIPMMIGLGLGFVFLWAVRYIEPSPVVGLLSLVLSAASLSALYSYIFIERLRTEMLFLTLGTALGALLHVVFFPQSVRDANE